MPSRPRASARSPASAWGPRDGRRRASTSAAWLRVTRPFMMRREKPTREAATPRLAAGYGPTQFAECANIQCSDGSRAMADVAHDASGPASPKPDDIALQQASRPDSPDRGKLRVFISYSRDDLYFADQLDVALNACGCGHPSRHAGC